MLAQNRTGETMKRIFAGLLLVVGSMLAASTAWSHGSRETPVSFGPMATVSIVHRLHLMGYADVKVIKEGEDLVDFEVARGTTRYTLTLSRQLTGPRSIAVVNPREVVERLLQPVSLPPDRAPTQ